jgi:hypothetical protein
MEGIIGAFAFVAVLTLLGLLNEIVSKFKD